MQERHEKAAGANSGDGLRVSTGCAGIGGLGLASGGSRSGRQGPRVLQQLLDAAIAAGSSVRLPA